MTGVARCRAARDRHVNSAIVDSKTEPHLGSHLKTKSAHAASIVDVEAGEVVRDHIVGHVVGRNVIGVFKEVIQVRLLFVVHESWARSILRVAELIVVREVVGAEGVGGDWQ